jgi:hypothetical protein
MYKEGAHRHPFGRGMHPSGETHPYGV